MSQLLSEERIEQAQKECEQVLNALNGIILGQEQLCKIVLVGLLAKGHILLEGMPGLGKTELVKALAALVGLDHSRIQFTPDLLPADITGTRILQEDDNGQRQMQFQQGPLFSQIVLADEINRASPKTQSALLQAMQEQTVTVFDQTYPLPLPFFVLATQNPVEQDGTYPLPEAQLDRFAFKITVTGITTDTLAQLLIERPQGRPDTPAAIWNQEKIENIFETVKQIALPEAVATYIARLVNGTRPELDNSSSFIKQHVRWGASPRAGLALSNGARALALLNGKPAVGFEDVKALAAPVLRHRLILSYEANLSGVDSDKVVQHLLTEIPELQH